MRRLVHPSGLAALAPDLFGMLDAEEARVEKGAELIASESYPIPEVVEAAGNINTAKYQEGWPYRRPLETGVIDVASAQRYYGGTEVYDRVELAAIGAALDMFGLSELGNAWACVQAPSGTIANFQVLTALAPVVPGESRPRMLGQHLKFGGGHLSHGAEVSITGQLWDWQHFMVRLDGHINYAQMAELLESHRPRVLVVGGSAVITAINFRKVREIVNEVTARTGVPCYIVADIAHPAGLIAARVGKFAHADYLPWGYADVVTTTTQKTLRGTSGGLQLMANDGMENLYDVRSPKGRVLRVSELIEKAVFPGSTGKALGNMVFAKAVGFRYAATPGFRTYAQAVLDNARAMVDTLITEGIPVVAADAECRGTENHCWLVDVDQMGMKGKQAEGLLARAHITVNVNTIPADPSRKQSPLNPFGVRMGSPALTCREGFGEEASREMATIIAHVLRSGGQDDVIEGLGRQVHDLMRRHPLYTSPEMLGETDYPEPARA